MTTGAPPKAVSIIVLTWNAAGYTAAFLDSLAASRRGHRLIVVDNGSTDGTLDLLNGLSDATILRNEQNLGFVAGVNRGLAAADPDSDVVLLNNDLVITQDDWLERLQATAYADERTGVVGCRLRDTEGRLLHAGTYMPTSTWHGQQIGSLEVDVGQYPQVRVVEGIVFACAYLKRAALRAVGELDTAFVSYFEDTDFCLRARQAGFQVVVDGGVTLTHHEHASTRENGVSQEAIFARSRDVFRQKWERQLLGRFARRVEWRSIFNGNTGYAVSSRHLARGLEERGVGVDYLYAYGPGTPLPLPDSDSGGDVWSADLRGRAPLGGATAQVSYCQGDCFFKNSGEHRIGFTMLEVDRLPPEWVRQANALDEVWVPSSFNVETFRESGVTRPIHIVPLGMDPGLFFPAEGARRLSRRFTFLSVFEWGERKAPELLLRAWSRAFSPSDDVLLVLKVRNRDGSFTVEERIAAAGLRRPHAPVHVLLDQELPDAEMGALYRGADAFVLATRGEGWGMPILEAMACGLPTIAPAWSAHRDFHSAEVGYPVEIKRLIPARAKCPYYEGARWADPDEEHLIEQLRRVHRRRDEARAVGRRAAAAALSWTWAESAGRIAALLAAAPARAAEPTEAGRPPVVLRGPAG
jgi:GT2 family glycosyltransferase